MIPLIQRHHVVHNAQLHMDDTVTPTPSLPGQQYYGHFPFLDHRVPRSNASDSLSLGRGVIAQRFSRPPIPLPNPALLSELPVHRHLLEEQPEYQLRRKTPNGTIDAGYDGNPSHLASGPPPFKHMHMGRPGAFPAPVHSPSTSSIHLRSANEHWTHSGLNSSEAPGMVYLDVDPTCSGIIQQAHSFPFTTALALDSAPNGLPRQHCNVVHPVPPFSRPIFQQSPGPAIVHGGYVLPPSAWPEANAASYTHALNAEISAYHNIYNRSSPNYYGLERLANQPPTHPLGPRLLYDVHPGVIQAQSQKLESLTLDAERYKVNMSHGRESSSPAHFREKVLALGHRTYMGLLNYLHQNKKSSSRTTVASRTSSRMSIFPKPSKSPSYSSSPLLSPQGSAGLAFTIDKGASLLNESQTHVHVAYRAQSLSKHHFQRSEWHTSIPYRDTTSSHLWTQDIGHVSGDIGPGSPLTRAKSVIGMLTELCEQSEWKWIEGMLLGGCLHYGLENYEQSLEWFQRIVSLDDSHVEAVSNMAASLYCLDRLEDAEKYWLQAIRRQPAYLEAVELLVHLLSTNHRNEEAVEIITFVQQALRLDHNLPSTTAGADTNSRGGIPSSDHVMPPQPLHGGSDSRRTSQRDAPAFGLSGYSVPASENGRMIALIHAKGNLLYALKDIDRASDAFEEAVLISAGKSLQCIRALICRIQSVLSDPLVPNASHVPYPGPLLLPPERARCTAQLVFATDGELPGLRYIPEGTQKKTAVSTTSNSLLSLAKIFQDAMSNGGSYPRLLQQPPGVSDILALYYLSLSLSESPSTANNVGILLASIQHARTLSTLPPGESHTTPQIPGITPGSGLALALAYYHYGLSLDSKHVHLHTNLGSLLKDIGQLDLAIQMYERAVSCDGTFDIALTNLANAVKDRGRISDAIGYYRRAVSSNPQFAEAVCGLSTALNSVCDWRGRGGVLLDDCRYDRWHVDDQGMLRDAKEEGLGSGLMQKVVSTVSKQLADSSQWGVGVLQNGELETLARQLNVCSIDEVALGLNFEVELGKWAGLPWEGSRVLRLIERATKLMVHRWYVDRYVTGKSSVPKYIRPRIPAQLPVPAAPTVLPFHTFTCPLSAKNIRMISQRNAARIGCSTLRSPWLPSTVYPPPRPPSPELNVGYVSSDFNNHPLAHLMQSVFGFHDIRRVKAVCYATTTSDRSVHRLQIEREAPLFRDVSNWPAEQIVQQIVNDNIHILVNLNGYTRGAKNEVFAARPAPIQMSFMGFAGTLGAEWCDYLLADETAIPRSTLRPVRSNWGLRSLFSDEEHCETEHWVYSENIIFCRDTFFCCDHAQSCEPWEKTLDWEDELRRRWQMRRELFPTLPDDTIIMGNFNQLYKIDPTTFRTWLRILSNVPKAILWLLRFPELGESNLKRTARAWAGEEVASRLVFTDVAPKQQHISRARVCDIFLDTPECNAHTTAADVLWSSTPLLTLTRYPYKMCSRMAASILKGALPKDENGLRAAQELIASDDAEYEALATRLVGGLSYRRVDKDYCEGRGRLVELRKILFEAKWTCALFDTHRWVSDLETAYEEAWRRWVAGESGDIHL
ncbi:glycosyltransferase family 41 protein [Poronia punctata]|nr:glycosyltransferase family 41 protein [Poronia punctata]